MSSNVWLIAGASVVVITIGSYIIYVRRSGILDNEFDCVPAAFCDPENETCCPEDDSDNEDDE